LTGYLCLPGAAAPGIDVPSSCRSSWLSFLAADRTSRIQVFKEVHLPYTSFLESILGTVYGLSVKILLWQVIPSIDLMTLWEKKYKRESQRQCFFANFQVCPLLHGTARIRPLHASAAAIDWYLLPVGPRATIVSTPAAPGLLLWARAGTDRRRTPYRSRRPCYSRVVHMSIFLWPDPTQPNPSADWTNPTQPNPWVNPTHGQLCATHTVRVVPITIQGAAGFPRPGGPARGLVRRRTHSLVWHEFSQLKYST